MRLTASASAVQNKTIANTHPDNLFDSQNISAVSFQISNGSSFLNTAGSSTTTATGTQVLNHGGASNISLNTPVTPTTDNVTWNIADIGTAGSFGAGNVGGGANKVALGQNAFVLSAQAGGINFTPNGSNSLSTIIGPGNASGAFDGTDNGTGGTCGGTGPNPCNSGFPIASYFNTMTNTSVSSCSGPGCLVKDTSEYLYGSVTFSFTISGLSTLDTIQNVHVAYGPDGPDKDDWLAGTQVVVPEPGTLALGGAGLMALLVRRRLAGRGNR